MPIGKARRLAIGGEPLDYQGGRQGNMIHTLTADSDSPGKARGFSPNLPRILSNAIQARLFREQSLQTWPDMNPSWDDDIQSPMM